MDGGQKYRYSAARDGLIGGDGRRAADIVFRFRGRGTVGARAHAPPAARRTPCLCRGQWRLSLWHQDRGGNRRPRSGARSEEHTSELQSLMRISYAVFCFKKKNTTITQTAI